MSDRRLFAYHVTPVGNLANILVRGLEPRTGPRAQELGEVEDAVYLFRDADCLDQACWDWLFDAFPEEEVLALLEVDLSRHAEASVSALDWELAVRRAIPARNIRVLSRDLGAEVDLRDVLQRGRKSPRR